MTSERLEPFRQALVELRRRLRDGALEPGARVTAKEVAEQLRLSPTPVREALSRLAGEGLLEERRGDGFFVPELSAADIAVLYRTSEHLLLMAQDAVRGPGPGRRPGGEPGGGRTGPMPEDPVRAVEVLFLRWAADARSRALVEAHRKAALQLAPVRRREGALIAGLAQEAESLLALAGPAGRRARGPAIRAFHRRRVAVAEGLADLVAARSPEAL